MWIYKTTGFVIWVLWAFCILECLQIIKSRGPHYERITSCNNPSYDDLLYDEYIQYIIIIVCLHRELVCKSRDFKDAYEDYFMYTYLQSAITYTAANIYEYYIPRNKSLFRCLPRWQSLCNILLLLFMWLGVSSPADGVVIGTTGGRRRFFRNRLKLR